MIYIKRFLWLLGYPIMFICVLCIFVVWMIIIYPLLGAFYYIKTGDCENIPFDTLKPVDVIIGAYNKLEPGNK